MAKLLIVDDSMELLEVMSHILHLRKFEVKAVSTKEELASSLIYFQPDLIMLDIKLKVDDGRALCREIKETSCKTIPIILTSASPKLLKDFEECKADAVIEKPFDIKTVLTIVTELLNKFQKT